VTRDHGGDRSWPARIARLTPLGGLERLEVDLRDGTRLQVELTRQRSRSLALAPGEDVFVTPKAPKVFPAAGGAAEDYAI
jgi:sulfate/thiosulfate transport system ATP-binding protein